VTETEISEHLTVEVERSGAQLSVISLAGELDLSTIPAIEGRLLQEIRSRRGVVIDLTRVAFIDSSGIGLLIQAFCESEGSGWLHIVIAPSSQVERVFTIAGVDRALPLFLSLDEAVEALALDRGKVA
jgi:anti-anti-sigma factor